MPMNMDGLHNIDGSHFNDFIDTGNIAQFLSESGNNQEGYDGFATPSYSAMLKDQSPDGEFQGNSPTETISLDDTLNDLRHIIAQDQENILEQPSYYLDGEKPQKTADPALPACIDEYDWTESFAAEESLDIGSVSKETVHVSVGSMGTVPASPAPPVSPVFGRHQRSNPSANLPLLNVDPKIMDSDQVMSAANINEETLASLKSADVDKTFAPYGKQALAVMKKRRRTIKNRKYAQHSRQRKKARDTNCNGEVSVLQDQLKLYAEENARLKKSLRYYETNCQCGITAQNATQNSTGLPMAKETSDIDLFSSHLESSPPMGQEVTVKEELDQYNWQLPDGSTTKIYFNEPY